ncbi:Wzz/FepE/Etk N-terminal domain-containing protein [uncultured Paracoccus sp.]|uniref:Wzz/FepE/Etk N-terminal domain-containing protein n=1 Tax=uncultured Paracoccus sp. TaxID=189685 RepID=UPI002620A652|nr:Wzz/FepE/Etk N-terminal domain-containing protein [uncultured Paracoccus sp.]
MPNKDNYEPLDLTTLGQRIFRHKWYILLTALIVGLASALPIMLLPDTYVSTSTIKIENSRTPALFGLGALVGSPSSSAETESTIMTSRSVLSTAIETAGLDIILEPAPRTLSEAAKRIIARASGGSTSDRESEDIIAVTNVSIPDELLDVELLITTQGGDRFTIAAPGHAPLSGSVDQPLSPIPAASVTVTTIPDAADRKYVLKKETHHATLQRVQDNLTAKELGKTGIVELIYTGHSATQAQASLDAIVNSYITLDNAFAIDIAQNTLSYAEQQIGPILATIKDAEDELTAFRKAAGTVSVEFEAEYLLTQLQELEQKLRQDQRPEERKRLEEYQAEFNRRLEALPDTQQRIFNLTRRIEVAQEVYLELMKKVEEARAQRIAAKGSTRLIDAPNRPTQPYGPQRNRLIVMLSLLSVAVYVTALALTSQSYRRRATNYVSPKSSTGPDGL